MAYQRGDIVLIPFPFSDLTAVKTRPAVVVSSNLYHSIYAEILLAYVSSQVAKVENKLDYVLQDWQSAGLLKPSFVRPKLAAIDPQLVVFKPGKLSSLDLMEIDRRLYYSLGLRQLDIIDTLTEVDLRTQPPKMVFTLAEKSIMAAVMLAKQNPTEVDITQLNKLLNS